jgi:hypothetical protein
MNLSEQEIRILIRDEIKKAFSITGNTDIEYLDIKSAAIAFGYKNPRRLYYLVETGVLRIGKEVQDRRPPNSTKAVYFFNKQACLKRLNTPPGKRAR